MSAALWQLAAMPFCVADKLAVACASSVPGAAVPWKLYGLKIAETQSALKPIVFFQRSLSVFACCVVGINQKTSPSLSLTKEMRPEGVAAFTSWIKQPTIGSRRISREPWKS
jgi:hypothetical protein